MPLDLLGGIDRQKAAFLDNARRHAEGAGAHDALLWGVRGTGKSALVKSAVGALAREGLPIRLVEADGAAAEDFPALFRLLEPMAARFILFIDDIGFARDDPAARRIRSLLDGGAEARPANVRLAVTSNRRSIVDRQMTAQEDPVNSRDAQEDQLALADRFGLKLGFQAFGQDVWLQLAEGYARRLGLPFDPADARAFARGRGDWSGRTAWHFAVEIAGRAGRSVELSRAGRAV